MPAVLAASLELPSVSFFGRSLNEYAQFFALDVHALRGRAVLDVGGGPSSFTAEACRRGVDAVAIDPRYGAAPDALAAQVEADYAHMTAQMRARPRLFRVGARRTGPGPVRPAGRTPGAVARRWPGPAVISAARPRTGAASSRPPAFFGSLDEAAGDRRAAADRFLADYEARLYHGRYIEGGLPHLPFFDGAFDLVLCAHLLFTYAARFDFDWHLAACRELARVSAGEVRIHPLCGLDGKPYPELGRLRAELEAGGVRSRVDGVAYEFFVGGNSTLVLNPVEASGG